MLSLFHLLLYKQSGNISKHFCVVKTASTRANERILTLDIISSIYNALHHCTSQNVHTGIF